MALYNILKAEMCCPSCDKELLQDIQFQYGDTYQHEYRVGDSILWSSSEPNNDWGCSTDGYVVVEGLGKKCSSCVGCFPVFDIYIKKNVIEKVTGHSDKFDFSKDNVVIIPE